MLVMDGAGKTEVLYQEPRARPGPRAATGDGAAARATDCAARACGSNPQVGWCWPMSIRAAIWRACGAERSRSCLVLELLPKQVNFSGGPDLVSWLGTFSLERVLGTVPVEEDGSACFDVPACRPVFFVALDENDMSVQRMHSFVSVMPGETTSCVGCHEARSQSPASPSGTALAGSATSSEHDTNRSPTCLTCWISRATSSRSSIGTAWSATTISGATGACC